MYIDVLTQIKNAQQAKKEKIKVPHSQMDMAVLKVLSQYNYIAEATKKGRMPKRVIEIRLKYKDRKGAINDVRFISKPSRRVYAGFRELKSVRQGYGLAVITTPEGVMTTGEARKKKLGGELLFEVW